MKTINDSVVCTLNIYVQGPSLKYCLFRESEHIETKWAYKNGFDGTFVL